MKNKILLVYPKFYKVDFDAKSYPLGLLSIGTILKKQGYEVKLIDFLVEDNPWQVLKNELDNKVLCVGISVMTPQIRNGLEISKIVNNCNKDIPIIWGGIHPTLFPKQTIANSLVDYVIKGEGEISFPKLLNFFARQEDLENIAGLIYQRDGEVMQNPEGELVDLNNLPMMDYSLLSPKTLNFGTMILNTSRGCPFRCAFCVNVSLHTHKWRYQKPEKTLAELDYIVNKLGYKRLKFQEDNFFVSKQRTLEVLEGISEKGLRFIWFTSCRVDFLRDDYINDDFLEKLKASGCYKLNFGAESGSQRLLDFLKKDITVEQIINSAKMCQRHGINASYSFMCALPTETKAERMQTLKLIDELIAIGPLIDIASPQPYRPYPGDELARQCERMGFKFPAKLEDWQEVVAKSLDSSSSNLEDFPWIKNPNEIRLQRVCSIIVTSRKKIIDYVKRYPFYLAPFIVPFYLLEKLRWRFKFFGLPIEYSLFINTYWWTQKLRRNRFLEKFTRPL